MTSVGDQEQNFAVCQHLAKVRYGLKLRKGLKLRPLKTGFEHIQRYHKLPEETDCSKGFAQNVLHSHEVVRP